jgi:predicted chitinase
VLAKFAELWRKAPPLPPEFVTLDDLLKITLAAPKERLQKFVAPLNQHFEKYKVNTPLRVCHFLAQVLHESGEFQYQEEIASVLTTSGAMIWATASQVTGCASRVED